MKKIFIILILILFPFIASAHVGDSGMNEGKCAVDMMMGGFGVWGWLSWSLIILLWVLIVLGIIALIKWIAKK